MKNKATSVEVGPEQGRTVSVGSGRLVRRFWHRGEVRLNEDMTVDEVVASGVGVHVEQMSDDHWWMSIDGKQGRRLVLHFIRRGRRINLAVEDDGYYSSGICEGFDSPNSVVGDDAKRRSL